MNKTKIEWCDDSWNPVTGCQHGCPYCYARGIARRFGGYCLPSGVTSHSMLPGETGVLDAPMETALANGRRQIAPYPYDFAPTFHRYRLSEPELKTRSRNIFVCSMADLFGAWVPTSWIVEILDACRRAPQHRYLFLTKNPERYLQLDHMALLPHESNFWYGSSLTCAEDRALWMEGVSFHTFLSIEPLLGPIDLERAAPAARPEWVIIGAETGSRREKVEPEREWVDSIFVFCLVNDIPVFFKDSVYKQFRDIGRFSQFPWEDQK